MHDINTTHSEPDDDDDNQGNDGEEQKRIPIFNIKKEKARKKGGEEDRVRP